MCGRDERSRSSGVLRSYEDGSYELGQLEPIKVTRSLMTDGHHQIWMVTRIADGTTVPITLNVLGNEVTDSSNATLSRPYIARQRGQPLHERSSSDRASRSPPCVSDDQDCREACHFHKKIMKTFVLFFISIKLIVLARTCHRSAMYARWMPNGFIAAEREL